MDHDPIDEICKCIPELPHEVVRSHCIQFGSSYASFFHPEAISQHIQAIRKLEANETVVCHIEFKSGTGAAITVISFDSPYLFSLLTGLLAQRGLNIVHGMVFTSSPVTEQAPVRPLSTGRRRTIRHPIRKRAIIDHFAGTISSPVDATVWMTETKQQLHTIFSLLHSGREKAETAAREKVNNLAAAALTKQKVKQNNFLLPVSIELDNNHATCTRMEVFSEDTPFFLYSLSLALAVNNISIEEVKIETDKNRIRDIFYLLDGNGKKISDTHNLNRLKLAVLLTKQFAFFLSRSPNPYAALTRFEAIVKNIISIHRENQWKNLLTNPKILSELAELLGTSDFLWEDFIRGQYETIIPMLLSDDLLLPLYPDVPIEKRLYQELKRGTSFEEKKQLLNSFKDREIYLIDLACILNRENSFDTLGDQLTRLAEAVITVATDICFARLSDKYGFPLTVAGLEAEYALFGLGKLGGAALGYASDIELLFVYSDSGNTIGKKSISNEIFFEQLVKSIALTIEAKREGIFQTDLRLRPWGQSGPLSTSLARFIEYYSASGPAHSVERLALVRLRLITGSTRFGKQVERIRDQLIYETDGITAAEVFDLRKKQYLYKTGGRTDNAKFSQGGLVDIEYTVQLLQIKYGKNNIRLRTPLMYTALSELENSSIINAEATEQIRTAYGFLRKLINGLRMLRGSALDLYLPQNDSPEMVHLARRIGYTEDNGIAPEQRLAFDYEMHTAFVRSFLELFFGEEAEIDTAKGTIADCILNSRISHDTAHKILAKLNFREPEKAFSNFKRIAEKDSSLYHFATLSVLAGDIFRTLPDPDLALNTWERFTGSPEFTPDHFDQLLKQPKRIEILLSIFSHSHFLSNSLIQNPEIFRTATIPEFLQHDKPVNRLGDELNEALSSGNTAEHHSVLIRKFRRQELLRISIKDMYLGSPLGSVTKEISALADSIIIHSFSFFLNKLFRSTPHDCGIAIFAFGKLGGNELNYSSDIDLLVLFDENRYETPEQKKDVDRLCARIITFLSAYTAMGNAYRVDMRLRPHGAAGSLSVSNQYAEKYYATQAVFPEIQALLKLRFITGDRSCTEPFQKTVQFLLLQKRPRAVVTESIRNTRKRIIEKSSRRRNAGFDVKNGEGGIRDIEFLVQGLILLHAHSDSSLLSGNTLEGISLLEEKHILEKESIANCTMEYLFLRKIEHFLQIYEDRQTHEIPDDEVERELLSRRVLGSHADRILFENELDKAVKKVHSEYMKFISSL